MTLAKIEYLYSKITGQTLINYIRSGLCTGSPSSADGVVPRGHGVHYPDKTIYEAATARSMLIQKLRKLDMKEVIIARKCADIILSSAYIDPNNNEIYIDTCKNVLKEDFEYVDCVDPEYIGIRISKSKYTSIHDLKALTAEWIMKYMWFSAVGVKDEDVSYFVFAKKQIKPVEKIDSFRELKIVQETGCFYIFHNYNDENSFVFKDKPNIDPFMVTASYFIKDKILQVKDKTIKIN